MQTSDLFAFAALLKNQLDKISMQTQIKFCRDVKSTELPAAHKQLRVGGGGWRATSPKGWKNHKMMQNLNLFFTPFLPLDHLQHVPQHLYPLTEPCMLQRAEELSGISLCFPSLPSLHNTYYKPDDGFFHTHTPLPPYSWYMWR